MDLLFAEFGLIYSNDWFMLPYPLAINTLCEIKGIVITDVFVQHALIRPAGRRAASTWWPSALFHHTDPTNTTPTSNLFSLPPSALYSMRVASLAAVNSLRSE